MTKTKLLSISCTMLLAGCISSCPPAQLALLPPAKIQTEQPGYFQTEWTKALHDFKNELAASSPAATN